MFMALPEFIAHLDTLDEDCEVGVCVVKPQTVSSVTLSAKNHRSYMKTRPDVYNGSICLYTKENVHEVLEKAYDYYRNPNV